MAVAKRPSRSRVFGAERADVKERRGWKWLARGCRTLNRRIAPVDHFQRIDPGHKLPIETEHLIDLLRLETNIGINEQEMRCLRRVQKLTYQRVAAAGNERIMPEQGECGVEIGLRCELNKADDGLHVMLRDKPSETGRGNEDHWSAWSPSHARPWEVVLWQR